MRIFRRILRSAGQVFVNATDTLYKMRREETAAVFQRLLLMVCLAMGAFMLTWAARQSDATAEASADPTALIVEAVSPQSGQDAKSTGVIAPAGRSPASMTAIEKSNEVAQDD